MKWLALSDCIKLICFVCLQNVTIAIVGKGEKFHILSDEENATYVAAAEQRPPPPDDGGAGGSTEPKSIDDFEVERQTDTGDPQVQVAMET